MKESRMCAAVVETVYDGAWVVAGHRTKTWKENEVASVVWEPLPVPEADSLKLTTVEKFEV